MTAMMLKEGINAIKVENIYSVISAMVGRDISVMKDMVIWRDATTIEEE